MRLSKDWGGKLRDGHLPVQKTTRGGSCRGPGCSLYAPRRCLELLYLCSGHQSGGPLLSLNEKVLPLCVPLHGEGIYFASDPSVIEEDYLASGSE